MSQTRTTVTIDDSLLKQVKGITKTDTPSAAIAAAFEQLVRLDALNRIAELLGTDPEPVQAPPRRRAPEFVNEPSSVKGSK